MDASMWVAKTGLDAQQTRMNVISNNLANVNTSGFKRDRAVFEDMLYQNIRQAGGQTDANSQRGVTILFFRPMGDHFTAIDLQDCHRHMNARICEDACHAEFLGDNA